MTTVSSTRVPFMDLARQHGPLMGELRDALDRVIGSSGFILGEEVEHFERDFSAYCETKHTIGVASGTAALTIMLKSAGIGEGDQVIVPAHTFIASALGVVHAGATPVCADVDPRTGLLGAEAAAAAIGPATSAILAVHLYGQPCEMDRLRDLARDKGLALFEDAAQAHGATYRGSRAGGLGTAAAFSFYPSKNLGALGDGGAICTDDDDLAIAARRWRDLGRAGPTHDVAGYNERLDGVQAAWLRVKLRHLDAWNAARRDVARAYREALDQRVELLYELPEAECNYHLYPIRLPDRDRVGLELAARGIGTGVHYPLALPDQPVLTALRGTDAPHAREWAARELSLPIFPGMSASEVETVTSAVRASLDAS